LVLDTRGALGANSSLRARCGEKHAVVAAFIGGGILDRHPSLRFGTLECGFGWLPFWGKRMDEQYAYVGSTAELKMKPSEYLQSGRYFCSIERQEGEEMYRMVSGFLGEDVLMYASDYPHSECQSQIRSTTSSPGKASSRKRSRNSSGTTPTASTARRDATASQRRFRSGVHSTVLTSTKPAKEEQPCISITLASTQMIWKPRCSFTVGYWACG
jgi:hypothetical protein